MEERKRGNPNVKYTVPISAFQGLNLNPFIGKVSQLLVRISPLEIGSFEFLSGLYSLLTKIASLLLQFMLANESGPKLHSSSCLSATSSFTYFQVSI